MNIRGRSFDFLGGARFFFEKNCLSHDLSKKNKLLADTVEKNCLFHTHGKLFLLQNKKKIVCVYKKREKKDCRCSSRKKNVCREKKNLAPPQEIKWPAPNHCLLTFLFALGWTSAYGFVLYRLKWTGKKYTTIMTDINESIALDDWLCMWRNCTIMSIAVLYGLIFHL